MRPGDKLPRNENVMLVSLGRHDDNIILLTNGQKGLEVSRTGRYAQLCLEHDRWDVALDTLSPVCATALAEAAGSALAKCRPYHSTAQCIHDGLVRTYDLLALPTSSRWVHTLIGVYVNERESQYNLLDAIFSTTNEGVLSLAAIRKSEGSPFDFQIVHHNDGAARLLKLTSSELLWQQQNNKQNLLCAGYVV